MADRKGDEHTSLRDTPTIDTTEGQMTEQEQAQFNRGIRGLWEEMDAMELCAQQHREANVRMHSFSELATDEMRMTKRAIAKINNEIAEMLVEYRAKAKLRKEALDTKSSDGGKAEEMSG